MNNQQISTSLRERARARLGASLVGASLVVGLIGIAPIGAADAATTTKPNPNSVCTAMHVATKGQVWLGVARKYKVSLHNLRSANKTIAKRPLRRGQRVCIPAVCITYTVRVGDSWTLIARNTKTPLRKLLKANSATTATTIHPKQALCLPRAANRPKSRPKPPPSTKPPTENEVKAIIRAAWPDNLEEKALVVAYRESRYNPRAKNYCCYGLFQLYWEVHKGWMKNFGVTRAEQLYDAKTNARMAYQLYLRAGGWSPWSQTAY